MAASDVMWSIEYVCGHRVLLLALPFRSCHWCMGILKLKCWNFIYYINHRGRSMVCGLRITSWFENVYLYASKWSNFSSLPFQFIYHWWKFIKHRPQNNLIDDERNPSWKKHHNSGFCNIGIDPSFILSRVVISIASEALKNKLEIRILRKYRNPLQTIREALKFARYFINSTSSKVDAPRFWKHWLFHNNFYLLNIFGN